MFLNHNDNDAKTDLHLRKRRNHKSFFTAAREKSHSFQLLEYFVQALMLKYILLMERKCKNV